MVQYFRGSCVVVLVSSCVSCEDEHYSSKAILDDPSGPRKATTQPAIGAEDLQQPSDGLADVFPLHNLVSDWRWRGVPHSSRQAAEILGRCSRLSCFGRRPKKPPARLDPGILDTLPPFRLNILVAEFISPNKCSPLIL